MAPRNTPQKLSLMAAAAAAVFGQALAVDVTWQPTILQSLGSNLPPTGDGGGNDEWFRASGMVVADGSYWTVNGVHPIDGSLSDSYPKSLVKCSISTDEIEETYPFSGAFDHDCDMEGLAWGPDAGSTYMYIGDEYNYIYQFELATGELTRQWSVSDIVGDTADDKGIESLTYSTVSDTFFVGIQDTAYIHEVSITPDEDCTDVCTVTEVSSFEIPESPSGMFYSEDEDLLYIMCGTETNGDQYIYVYTTTGTEECFVTIPSTVGLSRTDGIYIDAANALAYIADSQGPIYADDGSLGYNIYEVEWDNPCLTATVSSGPAAASPLATSTTRAFDVTEDTTVADSPAEVESAEGSGAFKTVSVTGAFAAVVIGVLAM